VTALDLAAAGDGDVAADVPGPGDAAGGAPVPGGHAWPHRFRRTLRVGGAVVFALWAIGLGAFSTMLYHRAYLTADFASYDQAWTLISHGHLNPLDTIWLDHVPFVRNDLELIVWPLALLGVVWHNPVLLLWVQDLAVAATGFVAYLWAVEYLERKQVSRWVGLGAAAVVAVVFVANPGIYQTLLFDFHIEPLSTLLVLLAARDLWNGRTGRAWVWIAPALLCGSFAAITVFGLGISALLAGRSTRRSGVLLLVAGAGWLGVITLAGANAGSGLDYYAYLAGRTTLPAGGGVVLVVIGMLTHPSRVVDQLHLRAHYLWLLVKPVGIVGLASAWGFGVPVTVLVVDALNSQYGFIFQAFQNFAVFPFVLVGTVMVLVWAAQRLRWSWIPAVAVAVAVTVTALAYGYTTSPGNVRWAVAQVSPADAAALRLALARTPDDAQVVATIGVMGRFSGRPSVFYYAPGRTYPVEGDPVVFVFLPANENTVPFATPADDLAAAAYVQGVLHAPLLVSAPGVRAYVWHPPPGTTSFTLPGAPKPASGAAS
jgi:hypothetical protein